LIKKGELRIGEYIKASNFDGTYPIWFLFKEFKKNQKKLEKFKNAIRNQKKIHNINALKPTDKEELLKIMEIEKNDITEEEKSKLTEEEKKNIDEEEKKKQLLDNENKMIWDIKEKLKKLNKKQLKSMLLENEQDDKGGDSILLERCAYGMLFGSTPECKL
jgi:isochorismate synthase EntC